MIFLKQITGAAVLGAALLLGLSSAPAQAKYIITLEQEGNDVVAKGDGSIDTRGLCCRTKSSAFSFVQPSVQPVFGSIVTGASGGFMTGDVYSGFTGPLSFGDGSRAWFPDSGHGNIVGISTKGDDFRHS
jgi:hypothetical protein